MWYHLKEITFQTITVANPSYVCCDHLNTGNEFSLFEFSPENLASRDTFGCRVPRVVVQNELQL